MTPKKIVLLGSTGSIGDSALKVVRKYRKDFQVVGLTTDGNADKLFAQALEFRPKSVGIVKAAARLNFLEQMKKSKTMRGLKVLAGMESLEAVATLPGADLVLSGVVGAVGLRALLSALQMGRTVALANKESLIMAGELVTRTARKCRARLLPVDSEHSAMFQCIQGQNGNAIHKIILTASGGPFYRSQEDLSKVTVERALAHPNWKMGRKITVDSATLMNKGLEAIEAHYLFGVPLDKIQIVIHRQSIIHSAVEFADGSILAQLSHPDMCLPIQYALTYPERKPCPIRRLDFAEMRQLDFEAPNFRTFPCLELALSAGRGGGTLPAALSAANEVAVYAFLDHRIRFTDIANVVERVVGAHKKVRQPSLDDTLEADRWARQAADDAISRLNRPVSVALNGQASRKDRQKITEKIGEKPLC